VSHEGFAPAQIAEVEFLNGSRQIELPYSKTMIHRHPRL
jgi:hypothetical protein